jgi:hypothetical protein
MSCLNSIDVIHIPSLPKINKDSFTNVLNINFIFPNHVYVSKPSTRFMTFPNKINFWACTSLISYSLPLMLSIEAQNLL